MRGPVTVLMPQAVGLPDPGPIRVPDMGVSESITVPAPLVDDRPNAENLVYDVLPNMTPAEVTSGNLALSLTTDRVRLYQWRSEEKQSRWI